MLFFILGFSTLGFSTTAFADLGGTVHKDCSEIAYLRGGGQHFTCNVIPQYYDNTTIYVGCLMDCPEANHSEYYSDVPENQCRFGGIRMTPDGSGKFYILGYYYIPDPGHWYDCFFNW